MRSGRHDIGGRNIRKDDRPIAIAQLFARVVVPNCAVSRTGSTPSDGSFAPVRHRTRLSEPLPSALTFTGLW